MMNRIEDMTTKIDKVDTMDKINDREMMRRNRGELLRNKMNAWLKKSEKDKEGLWRNL